MALDPTTWAERYGKAWEEADADAAAELFSEDATYRSFIFDEPHLGREAIKGYWRQVTATQENTTVRMGQPVVDGVRAAIEFWTTMDDQGTPVTLPGCLLLRFDGEGLCRSLHEYYHFGDGYLDPPSVWGGGSS